MADPKTVFLAPAQIHAAYHQCIQDAKTRLTLVMPWFTPSPQLKDAISGLLGKEVGFTLVTRPPSEAKNRAHDKALADLLSKQRDVGGRRGFLGIGKQEAEEQIEVVLVRNVHAKMVLQDADAVVVSSSNLNTMSVARNTEFGIVSRDKPVVQDAARAVDELRRSDRSSSTANGGIRRCECGGWVMEKGHEVCRSCYHRERGEVEPEETESSPMEEQDEEPEIPQIEPAAAEESAEPAAPLDPMICPKCGNRKMRKQDRVCRTCYYAGKGRK